MRRKVNKGKIISEGTASLFVDLLDVKSRKVAGEVDRLE
jgi:hypothetical protein